MVVLAMVSVYAHMRGHYRLSHLLGLVMVSLATVAVGTSVFLLVTLLPIEQPPLTVLRDAGLIWVGNVATFAVWYWAIDDGGPGIRRGHAHKGEDLQFPQDQDGSSGWSPDFTDYLFLAFNQSTAFGPTDTSIISKRAQGPVYDPGGIRLNNDRCGRSPRYCAMNRRITSGGRDRMPEAQLPRRTLLGSSVNRDNLSFAF
jgi:hypothetical protein